MFPKTVTAKIKIILVKIKIPVLFKVWFFIKSNNIKINKTHEINKTSQIYIGKILNFVKASWFSANIP